MNIVIPQLAARQPTPIAELDRQLAHLDASKQAWATLAIADKVKLLESLVQKTGDVAERWVKAACEAKGVRADSPLAGEEWISGPWALMYGANHYADTLRNIAAHGSPQLRPNAVRTRANGQVVVDVFPQSTWDALLLSGVHGEVWMQPGVTAANLKDNMAGLYREPAPKGHVALVLGAGNIASIGPLDVLHKLYAEGQVCLLKMNPVNEYLGAFLAEAFADYVSAGYVTIAYGGVDVGEYLTSHKLVEEIHITGSAQTHDAIVFGPGADGESRRARNEPRNPRRITSELGNVSPIIVVPGPWTRADITYQAEHIVTMKMHNAGFNCIAGQVLIVSEEWEHTQTLLDEIERVIKSMPNRVAYYPGASARQKSALSLPGAIELDPPADGTTPRTIVRSAQASDTQSPAFNTEAFCSVLSETRLGGDTATFLKRAVAFCNDTLWGTLGANVLIHPATERSLGPVFDQAIADLRYGCVAINAWTGVGFLLSQTTWGAFPGHVESDIRSGIGTVHNTFLFDRPQKSVVRQSFYPAPRGLLHGSLAILPKPPWFATNKTANTTGRRLVEFERAPGAFKLPAIFASALAG